MSTRKSQPYSEDEIAFLEAKFPLRGHRWCAKRLGRSAASVHRKATDLGLKYGYHKDYIPLSGIEKLTGVLASNIYSKAKREGVLHVLGAGHTNSRRAVVPVKWADAFVAQQLAWQEGEKARAAGYLTLREVCATLKLGFGTVQRALAEQPSYITEAFKSVRRTQGRRGRWLFNPVDVERVRASLEKERAAVSHLPNVKQLAAEADETLSSALTKARMRGAKVTKVLWRGRVNAFIEEPATEKAA